MTIKTYQELFHYTTFPVFALLRDTGKIIYKNFACEKYLPGLSKRNLLKPFVYAQNFTGTGVVVLSEPSPYQTAIALEDEEHSVFLFFSHFQHEDGVNRASQLFSRFGPHLTDFLAAVHVGNSLKTTGSVLSKTNVAMYTKMAQIQLDEKDMGLQSRASFYPAMSAVFEKLNSAFSEFGYCVRAKIEKDFPQFLHTEDDVKDILFVLGRLLYLQMKVSENKEANIRLACDVAYSRHVFYMTAQTNLLGLSNPSEDLKGWLLAFIPECKMEFSLLYEAGLLTDDNFFANIDRYGNLTLRYAVPYISPESYYIRSVDMPDIFLLQAVESMIESLISKLTDNGASC